MGRRRRGVFYSRAAGAAKLSKGVKLILLAHTLGTWGKGERGALPQALALTLRVGLAEALAQRVAVWLAVAMAQAGGVGWA